jgi:hypothetical protein
VAHILIDRQNWVPEVPILRPGIALTSARLRSRLQMSIRAKSADALIERCRRLGFRVPGESPPNRKLLLDQQMSEVFRPGVRITNDMSACVYECRRFHWPNNRLFGQIVAKKIGINYFVILEQ